MIIANSLNQAWFSTLEEILLPIGEKRLYNALVKYQEFKCFGDVISDLKRCSYYAGIGKASLFKINRLMNLLNINEPPVWPMQKEKDVINAKVICKLKDYTIYKDADKIYMTLFFKCSKTNETYVLPRYLGLYSKLIDKAYFLESVSMALSNNARDTPKLGISNDLIAEFNLNDVNKIYTSLYEAENKVC